MKGADLRFTARTRATHRLQSRPRPSSLMVCISHRLSAPKSSLPSEQLERPLCWLSSRRASQWGL